MERIRVLVADNHPAFREGLCRCLRDETDLEVVADTADGEDTVRLAKKLQPDVAIVGVCMPKISGIEAARQIKPLCPGTAILMVSAFTHRSYLLGSLRAGAAGYLLKTTTLSEVISAIRLVHAGNGVFDLDAAGKILGRLGRDGETGGRGDDELHSRQVEVLKLVARGMSNKRIAGELGISHRTVQTHLVSIFRKLGVGSRTEAVLRALREGWITLDDLPSGDGT